MNQHYKVGVNGGIDNSKEFDTDKEAIDHARSLWARFDGGDEEAGCEVAVYLNDKPVWQLNNNGVEVR